MSDLTSELKQQLRDTSENYKQEIGVALKAATDSLGKSGINALIISGALLTSYLLYRGLSGGKSTKRKKGDDETDVEENQAYTMVDKMADKVLEQTMIFLLTLAKEKLVDYLNETLKDNGDSESSSEKA